MRRKNVELVGKLNVHRKWEASNKAYCLTLGSIVRLSLIVFHLSPGELRGERELRVEREFEAKVKSEFMNNSSPEVTSKFSLHLSAFARLVISIFSNQGSNLYLE